MDFQTIKDKFSNLNQNTKYIIYGLSGLIVVGIVGLGIYHSKHKKTEQVPQTQTQPKAIKLDGVTTDFSSANEMSALKENQLQMSDLQKTLKNLQDTIKQQNQSNQNQKRNADQQIKELNKEISNLRKEQANRPKFQEQTESTKKQLQLNIVGRGNANQPNAYQNNQYALDGAQSPQSFTQPGSQIASFNFDFEASKEKINPFDHLHYAPTGTFVKAVMLNGADAAAGMTTQGNAQPVVFRLVDNAYAPNGKRIPLKGCFVTAGVTGDISSERGIIKLDRISCTKKDGSVLDIPVEGTAIDSGGKNGIRGIPVMRNGKVMMMSGLSGMLSGIGSTIAQASQTTSISPLGATVSATGADALKAGAGQGLNTAFAKISQFYIDLANQYHPAIQLNAGSQVDLIFLGGFSLDSNQSKPIGYHKPIEYNNQTEPKHEDSMVSNSIAKAKEAISQFKLGGSR